MEELLLVWALGLAGGGMVVGRNRQVVKFVARRYVAITEHVGRLVGPIRDNWTVCLQEARQERDRARVASSRRRQGQGAKTVKATAKGLAAGAEIGAEVS